MAKRWSGNRTLEIEGEFNFRMTTLSFVVDVEYGKDCFDVISVMAFSNRRNKFVPVSDRMANKFVEEKEEFLMEKCNQNDIDILDMIGDMKYEEMRERKALYA